MDFTRLASDTYDLDLLDDYLASLDDDAFMLDQLDGYLTAIALAPNTIYPNEWLPRIWGGEMPSFADATVANAILGSIMGLYNDNLRALADDGELFQPILMADTDGSPLVELWGEGFLAGMALRIEEWQPLVEDKEMSALLGPLIGLVGKDGEYAVDLTPEGRERLREMSPDMMPLCLRGIREYWQERGLGPRSSPPPGGGPSSKSQWMARAATASPEPVHAPVKSAKIGRNAPCPCGSGKKYKRCCGADA